MSYPTLEQVAAADIDSIVRWNRFLPSPTDLKQAEIITAIFKRLGEFQAADPVAFTAASKRVGWDN